MIRLDCQCGFKCTIHIREYFNKLSTIDKSKVYLSCPNHSFMPIQYYCVNCNVRYCGKCEELPSFEVHKFHVVYSKPEHTQNIEQLNNNKTPVIEKGKLYLDETLPRIKEKYSKEFDEDPRIEDIYQKSLDNNRLILQLIQLIINYYRFESFNYNMTPSLFELKQFNFSIFKINSALSISEQLVEFFSSLCIYKDTISLPRIKILKVIQEEKQYIFSAIKLHDDKILYGTNKAIKIINLHNYNVEYISEQHTNSVSDIAKMEDGTIITVSYDRSIAIWNYNGKKIKCIKHIKGAHTDKINKVLPLTNNRFATASSDRTIKIWNSSYKYLLLEGHTDRVFPLLQVRDDIMISGAKDGTIKKWNLKTGKMISQITDVLPMGDDEEDEEDEKLIYGLYYDSFYKMDNERVLVSGNDTIRIINIENMEIEIIVQDKVIWESCCFLEIKKGLYLVGGCEGGMCLYDDRVNKIIDGDGVIGEGYILRIIKIDERTFMIVDGTLKFWIL